MSIKDKNIWRIAKLVIVMSTIGLLPFSCQNNSRNIGAMLENEGLLALSAWNGEKADSCGTLIMSLSQATGSDLMRAKAEAHSRILASGWFKG